VNLADQSDVTVTFTNTYTPSASLTIKKVAGDDSTTEFSFTITGPNSFSDSFSLKGGGEKVYSSLIPGSYVITETDPGQGWNVSVNGGNNQNPCTVNLADQSDVTVTFTNTYTTPPSASLTIKKIASDASCGDFYTPYPGSDWEFNIQGPDYPSGDNFSLEHNETKIFSDLTPGTYTITETETWDYTCTVSGGNNNNPCEITLAGGDNITLTFTNRRGFNIENKQHLMITNASSGLQRLVDDHPAGVLATMRVSSTGSGNYPPNPYFYVNVKTHSGSYDETGLSAWCLTRYKNISIGVDYTVILFPADDDNPSIGNKVAKVWGILELAKSPYPIPDYPNPCWRVTSTTYSVSDVQNAIWKVTDDISLFGCKALYLYNQSVESSGSGIVAIPVVDCSPGRSRASTLSREMGIPVNKNK
jgi:FlaG/FlaF family flagellin (archaellin)